MSENPIATFSRCGPGSETREEVEQQMEKVLRIYREAGYRIEWELGEDGFWRALIFDPSMREIDN